MLNHVEFFHHARGVSRWTFLAVLHKEDGLQLRACAYTSKSLMDKDRRKKSLLNISVKTGIGLA